MTGYRDHPLLQMIGGTPLVTVRCLEERFERATVRAKAEWCNPGGSIKDRPVLAMLRAALQAGDLGGERRVLDSSSGNAGIAYAMIGRILGCPVTLVVPGNASRERLARIRAHGAELVLTDPLEGYDEALREAHRMARDRSDRYFQPDQYANEANWKSHHDTTAEEILEQTGGRLTHFVAGVGTGGTITGVGRRLKEHDPSIQIVLVEPEVFPGIEGLKPLTEGSIVPDIFDESVVDFRVPVTAEASFAQCQRLAAEGFFVGQSSGAYLAGVEAVLEAEPSASVVTVFSDLGERYISTGLWDDG